ncbi:MAG: Hsp20/alpha crystallin family protein [Anaerolineae bacterium]|nr:Hsp20/alpha crystallin family protein [Anaerolineae bacterium]
MSDSKFDPIKSFGELRDNLSRTIQQGIRQVLPNTYPALDIYESGDNLVIQTEALIGLMTDKLEVSIEENTLMIKAETKASIDIPEGAYLHRERVFGAFERSIKLPKPVVAIQAKSSLKHLVLTITIPIQKEKSQIVTVTPIQE